MDKANQIKELADMLDKHYDLQLTQYKEGKIKEMNRTTARIGGIIQTLEILGLKEQVFQEGKTMQKVNSEN